MSKCLRAPVLTVDGPSGTGKGTIGSHIAKSRGWNFLDSGALYRAFAYSAHEAGVAPNDIGEIQRIGAKSTFTFETERSGETKVLVNGQDVSSIVRSEQGGKLASQYAAVPAVRNLLIEEQRRRRQMPGLVADGRDMGTVVFPDAILKIFLTATAEIRAKRRYKQLKSKDFDVNLAQLSALIEQRDKQDINRSVAPLTPAPDAVVIDTSEKSITDVIGEVDRLLTVCL